MNSFTFFYENFGKHFDPIKTNKPHMDASRVLRGSYKMKKLDSNGKPKPSRLAFGWAIIRPKKKSSIKLELDLKGILHDPIFEKEAFLKELKNWDETPRMFLLFGKAPIPISNLFLTIDLRAVRICTPKGVETFDFTKNPEDTESKFHKDLIKLDQKNAA